MLSFQGIILKLLDFWANQGCVLLQAYDLEMGAGTTHPSSVLYALGPKPWRMAFVQPSRRPGDGRYGANPNRLLRYYQFQVILKPAPFNVQDLLLQSYQALGLDLLHNDLRFVEDDWANPSLGAAGLGWEVWFNGMEITQFTYFQQVGGMDCEVIPAEITYGLERIAMCVQGKERISDLIWNTPQGLDATTYGEMSERSEQEFSQWYFEKAPIHIVERHFEDALYCADALLKDGLALPAYDQCIQANHLFNMLEARGAIGVSGRAQYVQRVRSHVSRCCAAWISDPLTSCNA
jgi:glycyl-tRNA synthetase alpha chain